MATHPYRSWIEVSRAQLAANFQAIRQTVGPGVELAPVVKADAYHHGAVEVSRVLVEQGAQWLAVSNVEEGVCLRQAGIHTRILVMADFLPVGRLAMLDYQLTPVLHSLDELSVLEELAAQRKERIAYHLKIDSGMGRLGTRASVEEICAAVRTSRHLLFEGLMTHFASAADYSSPQTEQQVAHFERVMHCMDYMGVKARYLHLSSTIPIAYGRQEAWRSMVRPGHALYGYVSPARGEAPDMRLDVKPALTWRASILEVKDVPAGTPIGYGALHYTTRPTTLAVVAAGYADGVPHRMSNKGYLLAGGHRAPVLGAVSMDLTTIDITDCPPLNQGDAVTIIGQDGKESLDAQQLARWAGTISYSVLCAISNRVKRVYV